MNANYLEFEQPIAELQAKIDELKLVGDDNEINISEEISKLQGIIGATPPPWLAKAMGVAAEQRVRFERETAE